MSHPGVPVSQVQGAANGPSSGYVNQLPSHLQQDLEIQQLADLYQQQLAELNACHSLLTVDQERLAGMLAPYMDSNGKLVMDRPDPNVMLFKQGLDLRLKEFEEDCKRIRRTEEQLEAKINAATNDFEKAVQGNAMSTDSRIFKRLREQQRLIELQQSEIDQIRYEKELLQDETKKLREMTHRSAATELRGRAQHKEAAAFPSLHRMYENGDRAPNLPGTSYPVVFPTSQNPGWQR